MMTVPEVYDIETGEEVIIKTNGKFRTIIVDTIEVKYHIACIFTLDGDYVECYIEEMSKKK